MPKGQAYLAICLYGAYLLLAVVVPPFAPMTTSHIGAAFGLVPMASFAAILFAQLNRESCVILTRALGWLGLVSVSIILVLLKLFIWQ